MPDIIPTEEQNLIITAAQTTTDNLAVVARAGAAKTSTLVMIAEALPDTSILCLAFNKKIAEEMTARLPANCTASTLHSLGFAAWRNFIQPRCNLMKNKQYQLLQEIIGELNPNEQEVAYEYYSSITEAINTAKSSGYLPERKKGHWRPLITSDDFYGSLAFDTSPTEYEVIEEYLCRSWDMALQGVIDFDDMIYCPALCSVSWPNYPFTLIDEAQDLSPLNHHILKKMVKNRRLIAVGDPLQAIYGFRGASVNSMSELIEMFHMTEYYLTISFRCAKAVTKNAQWIAPDMKWPEWAAEGEVRRLGSWSVADLETGDAVICRNNAPLFSLALIMLEHDKLPEIAGRDIAAPLIKLMKKLGKPKLERILALEAVKDWRERELRRARKGAKNLIYDKAAIMTLMIERTETLGEAQDYLAALVARPGRISLMTGHKSKGLEFNNVWFFEPQLIDIEKDQDANIRYVIETRAKERLSYITSDGLLERMD